MDSESTFLTFCYFITSVPIPSAGYKYPRTLSISGKALSHDHNVVKDGVSVGRKLVISKGITERGKSRRLLIEDKNAESG